MSEVDEVLGYLQLHSNLLRLIDETHFCISNVGLEEIGKTFCVIAEGAKNLNQKKPFDFLWNCSLTLIAIKSGAKEGLRMKDIGKVVAVLNVFSDRDKRLNELRARCQIEWEGGWKA